MKLLLRLLLPTGLIVISIGIMAEVHRLQALTPDDAGYDQTKILTLFLVLLACFIAAALLFAFHVLPAIAERFGSLVYGSNEAVEKHPHAEALALMAKGDYEGAEAAYRKIVELNPKDTHAISEAARLLCERLEKPEDAATFLETQIQAEWEMDDLAFLSQRLVDVYWSFLHDATRAEPILEQVIAGFEGTRHAANASHRLREIQRLVEEGLFAPKPDEEKAEAEEPPEPKEEELTIEFLPPPKPPAKPGGTPSSGA